MAFEAVPLHPLFGAEIRGVEPISDCDDATFGRIRHALDEFSLLLFRGQPLNDVAQVAFSRRFGPLETTVKANPAGGSPFARQSNLDMATGEIIAPDDRRMVYQRGNLMWHTDSSFKAVPALCSILSARQVPPAGGETDIASARAAYAALPADTKRRIEGSVAVHSLAYSRGLVDPDLLSEDEKAEVPPVTQPVVRTNPVNGRKSLYVGAHASHIVGLPVAEGRALLKELTAFATQPRFRHRHVWRADDVLVWDNRCLLHRARPYDNARHRRLMQRTTVAGDGPAV